MEERKHLDINNCEYQHGVLIDPVNTFQNVNKFQLITHLMYFLSSSFLLRVSRYLQSDPSVHCLAALLLSPLAFASYFFSSFSWCVMGPRRHRCRCPADGRRSSSLALSPESGGSAGGSSFQPTWTDQGMNSDHNKPFHWNMQPNVADC